MKTVIISDTHLNRRFNLRKFMFLVDILKDADRVVINGDFWDKTYTDFNGFIHSRWKLLFPLLKSKHTIYLYGNHDPEDQIDQRVNLFSHDQGYEYEIKHNSYNLLVTHGHIIRPGMDQLNALPFSYYLKKPVQLFFEIIEWFSTKLISRLGKNIFFYRYFDNRSLRKFAQALPPNEYLICGHTHLAFFKPEHRYINTGSIRFGHAHYLVLDKNGLKLVYERY